MFSLSNIITRNEFYSNESEKLKEDNMALVFAKLINLISSCVSVRGIVVSLLHHNCSRNRSCCARPEARNEMRAFPQSLSNKPKNKGRELSISIKI